MIRRFVSSLRGLYRRRQIDAEVAEELRDHLEREIEARRARGFPPQEARRLALRDLGGLTQTAEAVRSVRAIWLDAVWRDLHYGFRTLRRSPRFTITALLLLVLGIGSATAIFSVAYPVLVRPLPYRDSERLVFLAEKEGLGIAWPNFEDWRRRATSFDGLAGSLADAVTVTDGDVPRRFDSRSVTANFFHVLGVSPVVGRAFNDADANPSSPAAVMVSHTFWLRELGGDPAALGRHLSLNRKPFVVIGVLPPGFRFMTPADVYLLLEPQVAANYRGMPSRTTHTTFYGVGRLKQHVDLPTARTEMQTIAAALALEYPDANRVSGAYVTGLADRIVADVAPMLRVVAGAVTLLLLIACVNLASLLLNRTAARAHEFSIRAAIGGSRWSLTRQLLIEQALLVGIGGLIAVPAGAALLNVLLGLAPRDLPRLDEIRLDRSLLTYTALASCVCAFVCGIVPAFKASGITGQSLVIRAGRGSTRSASSLRRTLMMAEVAVATVLLCGSGLMVHTMLRLARVDPGFDPRQVHSFMFSLSGASWPDERKVVFYENVVERLRAVPGVENAAITYALPVFSGSNWWNLFTIYGRTTAAGAESPNAGMVPVTAGYFETLKIPLINGRYFDRSDTSASPPVAIVSSTLAREYWPGEDPIGQQIRQGRPNEPYGPWRTIVGVVSEIKQEGLDREAPRQIFMPIVQQPRTTVAAIVRTSGPSAGSSITAAFHELERSVPVYNERTLDQVMRDASSRRRIAMVVLSVFGGVAVLLAVIGLYGVIAQGVAERGREIGVRLALGATGGQILRLFLRHGLVIVAVGIGCGVVAAAAAARSLASLVFGVTATDPATLGAVAALLAAVALLASYLSARSATRVDPVRALRLE